MGNNSKRARRERRRAQGLTHGGYLREEDSEVRVAALKRLKDRGAQEEESGTEDRLGSTSARSVVIFEPTRDIEFPKKVERIWLFALIVLGIGVLIPVIIRFFST